MSGLAVPPGHHLLRLAAVTPANFGDAGGNATVDRPVALDAWDHLPYLPGSALKGVLAGRFGNLGLPGEDLDPRRAALFGGPDTAESPGGPGSLVIGDGELLAFPVRLRTGGRATVLVGRTVYRPRRLGFLDLPGLRRVERPDGYQGAVPPEALPVAARWSDFGIGAAALSALAGEGGGSEALVAAPEAAEALWRAAVEERTQTALGEGRVVERGSLRSVELIPPGTVFVSLVSNLGEGPAGLGPATPLQVGAWEAVGCGFLEPSVWVPPGFAAGGKAPERPAPRIESPPDHEVMLRAFTAVRAIRAERPDEAAVARSALLDLGPRLRIRGLPGTLAFCLAKAGGEERPGRRSPEREAYRWLLRQLLGLEPAAPFAGVHRRAVAAISGAEPPPAELETTWLWLRRYAETLLRAEDEA